MKFNEMEGMEKSYVRPLGCESRALVTVYRYVHS